MTNTAAPIEVRSCTQDDWPLILTVDEAAFGYSFDPEQSQPDYALLEFDRSLLAWCEGVPVGHTTAYSLQMSVPGGQVPVAGVTWVAVLPTHRRRGVLTELMRRQTRDIHERGEPVAALYASEPAIYPRFGFGLASQRLEVSIDCAYSAMHGPRDPALRTSLVTPEHARAAVEHVYAAIRTVRAGMPARPGLWWQRIVADPKARRDGASALGAVVVADGAGPRAYALYCTKSAWEGGSPRGEIRVREHGSLDAAAAHELWRLLLNVDLVATVSHQNMAVDDVLMQLLDDPRRARPALQDSLYVRLVDLPAALAARSYATDYEGVVQVSDDLAPWNAGRWRLSLHADGAGCDRTDAEPDLVVDVRALGAAYLGSTSLSPLVAAGQIQERRPGSAAALGRAMRHEPLAHCTFIF